MKSIHDHFFFAAPAWLVFDCEKFLGIPTDSSPTTNKISTVQTTNKIPTKQTTTKMPLVQTTIADSSTNRNRMNSSFLIILLSFINFSLFYIFA